MNGWPIVGWATVAVSAIVGIILAVEGTGADGLGMAIRATARTSVALFTAAFAASALRRRWRTPVTAWLLRNRRQLGVSYAASHFIHLLLIIAVAGWTVDGFMGVRPMVTIVGGGVAYVFIALMTLTSFDTTAAWLGPRNWRRLHVTGAYYNWFIFAQSFFRMVSKSLIYWPFAALVAGSMLLRWITPATARLQSPDLRRTAA
jgi:DMSO/TMAO reductase YedYZ heme-binding membrane subunit